jgi:hypothetical protein
MLEPAESAPPRIWCNISSFWLADQEAVMPDNQIIIDIPAHVNTDAKLKDFIHEIIYQLEGAIDRQGVPPVAEIDNIEIQDITIDGADVYIDLEYSWSAYYGCRDMNAADDENEMISGKRQGNQLIFDKYVEPIRDDEI